ncbi:hypothetical protein M406DRAFT_357014 [Cryphonectria parasitica EP155]|uniref:Cupin type-2 domain-containing protein n=1 Tax=Cryphonectria parasitica (strain ATCC 38755 / EP155) TaxID=660469 RepID=A0A9P5CLQ0_CRYP1|nr:uncharacterized protein M406DRAFT_357014 [Cryphonectria parasitica EP155]KAF3763323.1 hypothetical protein M406DRAFT_357014 [Cryphonectria parasitica EP155]
MGRPEIFKTLHMAEGMYMNILFDPSLPSDSLDRWQAEVVCEGSKPGVGTFSVPPHWHKKHSEKMTVIEGRIKVTIDGKEKIVGPGERITIPAYTVHSIAGFKGERLVCRERADPSGDYKAAFFNDLLARGWPTPFLYSMRVFYDGDIYPSLGLGWKGFDVAFVTVFGLIAKLFMPEKQKLQ